MPRPTSFSRDTVLGAAQDAFWESGYEGTALSKLERRTGLSRSSLYLAFGSKADLFGAVLERYSRDVLDPLLTPLEADPNLGGVRAFLARIQAVIVSELDRGPKGCLMINTIAELSTKDAVTAQRTIGFRDRLALALERALDADLADADAATITRRSAMLMASVVGIWTCARIDLVGAAALCDELAAEVGSWRSKREESTPVVTR